MKVQANLQKLSKSRLRAAIRAHEVEIISNRKSERCGECLIKFCTHRPSRSESFFSPKPS